MDLDDTAAWPIGQIQWRTHRLRQMETQLTQLLASESIKFDERCRRSLPEEHGVYRIFDPLSPDQTVRAGRTKTAVGGLRQRVYHNHLMGDQAGNLRRQLVDGSRCENLEEAKGYIRDRPVVQICVIRDERERAWFEHFMLSVLKPDYRD